MGDITRTIHGSPIVFAIQPDGTEVPRDWGAFNAAVLLGGNVTLAADEVGLALEAGGNLAAVKAVLADAQTVTPVLDPTAAAKLHQRLAALEKASGGSVVTATLAVAGDRAVLPLFGANAVIVQFPPNLTWDGQVAFEATADGTHWFGVPVDFLPVQDNWLDPGQTAQPSQGASVFALSAPGGSTAVSVVVTDGPSVPGSTAVVLSCGLDNGAYGTPSGGVASARVISVQLVANAVPDVRVQPRPGSSPFRVQNVVTQFTPLDTEVASNDTRTSADIAVTGSGLSLTVTLANKANSGSFTPKVQGKTASGSYYDLWIAAVALTANGTKVYQLGPSASTATQVTESKVVQLPAVVRVALASNGNGTTDAFDTTVDLDITP